VLVQCFMTTRLISGCTLAKPKVISLDDCIVKWSQHH
jgi:hypothetical protein